MMDRAIGTFSDGSSIKVTDIANNGAAKVMKFSKKSVTWVKFQVTESKGHNIGLSEIEVYSAVK